MRFIPTRIHGVLDYLTAALLVAALRLLGFARGGAETWVPMVLGACAALDSLGTAYELGVVPGQPHARAPGPGRRRRPAAGRLPVAVRLPGPRLGAAPRSWSFRGGRGLRERDRPRSSLLARRGPARP